MVITGDLLKLVHLAIPPGATSGGATETEARMVSKRAVHILLKVFL